MKTMKIGELNPSAENSRVIVKKGDEWKSFVASIKELGIQVPLIVRETALGYEIVAGHRRYEAAKELGLESVPVDARNLTDVEAREIRIVENLQRADLTVFEEAAQAATLLADGVDVKVAAGKLGKSVSWIYQRAQVSKLNEKLHKKLNGWTVEGMILLACQPEKQHKDIVDELTKWDRVPSANQVQEFISRIQHVLCDAAFDLEGCGGCLKRSGAQTELFGISEKDLKKQDKCLDPVCYQKKVQAYIKTLPAETVFISGSYSSSEVDGRKLLGKDLYRPATKKDKKAIEVVEYTTGRKTSIVLNAVEKKEAKKGKAVDPETGKAPVKPMKEKKAELERRRLFFISKIVIEKLVESLPSAIKLTIHGLNKLVAELGAAESADWKVDEKAKLNSKISKITEKGADMSDDEVFAAIWYRLITNLRKEIHVSAPSAFKDSNASWMVVVIGILGLDYKTLHSMAEEEIPTPKSWSK